MTLIRRMALLAKKLLGKNLEGVAPLAGEVDDILGELERNPDVVSDPELLDLLGEVQSGNLQGGDVFAYLSALSKAMDGLDEAGIDTSALRSLHDEITSLSEVVE